MDIPFNMTAPRPKLDDGEALVATVPGLRKKGIFGNRYGELHLTDRRLVFVKAVMKGLGAALTAGGAKPMLAFDLASISAEKVPKKKLFALVVTGGGATETFLIAEKSLDDILAMLPRKS